MKRLLAVLLLAGCDNSQDQVERADEPAAAPAPNLPLMGNEAAVDPVVLQARVEAAMKAVLQDAKGARYRNVRAGLADSICGEVDPRRRDGGRAGFRPFVVAADGSALVARGPVLSFDDPTDSFPDLYIRWCASEEELKRLGSQLDRAIARAAGPDGMLPGAEDIPPPEPDPALAQAPPPSGPPGEKMGKGESFFDEVRKPREPAKSDK